MPIFDFNKGTCSAVVNMQNIAVHVDSTNTDAKTDLTFKINLIVNQTDPTQISAVHIYLPERFLSFIGNVSPNVIYDQELNRVIVAKAGGPIG